MLIILWSITARWPWPNILPESFTDRGWNDIWRQRSTLTRTIIMSMTQSMIVAFLSVTIATMSSQVLITLSKRKRRLLIFLMSLPMLIPATVFGMGIQIQFIRWNLNGSHLGIVISHLVYSLPYANFLMIDGFDNLGTRYQEQAKICGANAFQSFYYITLPLLIPIMLSAFIMSYIVSFSQYFLTLMIGGGSIQTFTVVMYPHLLNNDRTIASTYSLLFLFFTMFMFLLFEIAVKYFQNKNRITPKEALKDVTSE